MHQTRVHWICFAFAVLVTITSNCFAQQNPNGVIPVHTSNQPYLFLVRDPVVHASAKLTDDQKRKLTALNNRLDPALWSMRNKGPQEIANVMTDVLRQTRAALPNILDGKQIERIQQAEYWVLGVKALLRDDVATNVGLSSDQSAQLRETIVAAEGKLAKLQKELMDGGDRDVLNEKWGTIKQDQQRNAIAILSDEQQNKFRALLGEPLKANQLGRIKMKVPDFDDASKWVNSPPLTLDKLKGKVVALHFYAFA